jgi:hypothetical protein
LSLRFTLVRSGGVAGISPPPLEVSTDDLAARDAGRLRTLVEAASFFDLPAEIGPDTVAPDTFGYELTVHDDAAGRTHSVAFDAASAPPELKELMSAVRAAARGRPAGT